MEIEEKQFTIVKSLLREDHKIKQTFKINSKQNTTFFHRCFLAL